MRGKRLLRVPRDESRLNFGRLAIGGSGVVERIFRPLELGDVEERLSFGTQKIETVRVFGERGLASRQTGLIFRQGLRTLVLVAELVDVADFHTRVDDVEVARFVAVQRGDLHRNRDRFVVFLKRFR